MFRAFNEIAIIHKARLFNLLSRTFAHGAMNNRSLKAAKLSLNVVPRLLKKAVHVKRYEIAFNRIARVKKLRDFELSVPGQ